MSAFIVDTKTMDRCVAGIFRLKDSLRYYAPTLAAMMPNREAISSALYALNESAVLQRYPGDIHMSDTPQYRPTGGHYSAVESYKALRCLRYQCSEGEADKSEIYRELDAIVSALAEKIVSALPEFERAPWG